MSAHSAQQHAPPPPALPFSTLVLMLLAIVSLSFYVRRTIGHRLWRLIHFLSYAMFALALLHGLQSGTDSPVAWARGMYWASAGSLLFLTTYRILLVSVRRKWAVEKRVKLVNP